MAWPASHFLLQGSRFCADFVANSLLYQRALLRGSCSTPPAILYQLGVGLPFTAASIRSDLAFVSDYLE